MDLTKLYDGTFEELMQIKREISRNQRLRAELDEENRALQQHQNIVLNLIRDKSRGGKR